MDTKKIKRMVAREGLILLCFIVISLSLSYLGCKLIIMSGQSTLRVDAGGTYDLRTIVPVGFFIIGYSACLLIRFIVWAIKTLRER